MDKSLEPSVSLESDLRALKESVIQEQLKSLIRKKISHVTFVNIQQQEKTVLENICKITQN